jgi:hypothetical protein
MKFIPDRDTSQPLKIFDNDDLNTLIDDLNYEPNLHPKIIFEKVQKIETIIDTKDTKIIGEYTQDHCGYLAYTLYYYHQPNDHTFHLKNRKASTSYEQAKKYLEYGVQDKNKYCIFEQQKTIINDAKWTTTDTKMKEIKKSILNTLNNPNYLKNPRILNLLGYIYGRGYSEYGLKEPNDILSEAYYKYAIEYGCQTSKYELAQLYMNSWVFRDKYLDALNLIAEIPIPKNVIEDIDKCIPNELVVEWCLNNPNSPNLEKIANAIGGFHFYKKLKKIKNN